MTSALPFKRLSTGVSVATISTLVLGSFLASSPAFAAPAKTALLPDPEPVQTQTAPAPETDRFIVKFKGAAKGNASERSKAYNEVASDSGVPVKEVKGTADGAQVVTATEDLTASQVDDVVDSLNEQPNVEYAEPDSLMRATATPNDTYYSKQWHIFEAKAGLNVPAAWAKSTGKGQVVAVIDTGITTHSDLAANILPGYDMISSASNARDGNGRDANPLDQGDWYTAGQCGTSDSSGSSWHGTHVAGTIAAISNNAKGVAGVAPGAKVVPVRVLGACGGYTSDIADAIIWASGGSVAGVPANANPAKTINLSLGGRNTCSPTTQNAINTAVQRGSAVVVAAGNENIPASYYSPANCQNVITVGAVGRTGAKASYSNYGSVVDVAAPGGDGSDGIAATLNTGLSVPKTEAYGFAQGTSMAAPQVAAVSAMMRAVDPLLTPAQIEARLKSTVRGFPVACSAGCGTGIVNANSAVIIPTVTAGIPTITGTAKQGSVLTASAGTWSPSPVTLTYQWNRAGVAIAGATKSTYTVTGADAGKALTVTVTGTKTGYFKNAKTSAATAVVPFGTLTTISVPSITGIAKVGVALTAVTGTWGPAPVTYSYQWYRSGAAITGATGASYVPTALDLGKTMSVKVTGSKSGYTSVSKTSASTAAVAIGTLTSPIPKITGTARVGYPVYANPGAWTAGTTLKYQWYRAGVAISGATASKYTLTTSDFNKKLTVRVTGSKAGFTSTFRDSGYTSVIVAGFLSAPTPTITGTTKSGYVLTAKPGTWTTGTTLKYQWYRSGVAIPRATGSSYRLVAADRADTIKVRVTGSKYGYLSAFKDSKPTVRIP